MHAHAYIYPLTLNTHTHTQSKGLGQTHSAKTEVPPALCEEVFRVMINAMITITYST